MSYSGNNAGFKFDSPMKKFLKNLLWAILVFVAVRVGVLLYQNDVFADATSGPTAAQSMAGKRTSLSNSDLHGIVAIANKRYPRVSTPGVRIEKMTAGDQLLTYHKTVLERLAADFDKSEFVAMRPQLIEEVCVSPLKDYLSRGVSVQNRFSDLKGDLIHEYTVRPQDCR